MFSTRLNYDCDFFVSGQRLSGIQSVDVGYENSAVSTKPLGYDDGTTTIGGPTTQTVSLTRYLIYDDPILSYVGNVNMSGSIEYDGIAYGFQSGYLQNYSLNCAVGAVPQVNTNFIVYDEMRSGYSASGSVAHPAIHIPSQGSISINSEWASTNRVIGMDYSVTCNRKPYYTIGSETPVSVALLPPLEVTASVQYDVDEAFLASGYAFLGTGKEDKTVTLHIDGRDGTALAALTVPNASLRSERLNASADGALTLTQEFVGHTS
jgi:hypothetical protein